MDLINQFIDNYKKKFNYYESVSRLAAGQLEAVLRSSGIRAMVTYRAKNPGRLKSKVLRRNAKRPVPYRNIKESMRTSPISAVSGFPSISPETAFRQTS